MRAPILSRPTRRERGAAIIAALLVVAFAAILVSGLLWRQQVQIRRIENQRLRDQAQWAARAATDWTRFILRTQADSRPVDYLGGEWAVPIAPTRVSDVLGHGGSAADLLDHTYLSGAIEDQQALYNVRNLVWSPVPGQLQPNPSQVTHFRRLLQLLGLDTRLADPIAQYLRSAYQSQATRFQTAATTLNGASSNTAGMPAGPVGAPAGGGPFDSQPGLQDGGDAAAQRPLPPLDLDALLAVPGVTPDVVARLRPFATVLPMPTTVNINTAPAEVLAAMITGLNLDQAQNLVSSRDNAYFINLGDLINRLGGGNAPLQPDAAELDVRSSFFLVHGEIDRGRAHIRRDTLIYRDHLTHTTRIVHIRDTY